MKNDYIKHLNPRELQIEALCVQNLNTRTADSKAADTKKTVTRRSQSTEGDYAPAGINAADREAY